MSEHDPKQQGWRGLGDPAPEALVEARQQLHWAAQVLSGFGYTHLQRAADDGQSNTGWVDGMQLLAGRPFEREPGGFLSLTPATLHIALHEPGGDELESFALEGHTLDEAYAWVEDALARHWNTERHTLVRPEYEMPPHPLQEGARFSVEPAALCELARWIHDGNLVMRDLRARERQATMPRMWPHHFDLGMTISLEEHGNPLQGRSIGLGLSLGDAMDPAPYFYAYPYPRPEDPTLPDITLGEWKVDAWFGAKLDARKVVEAEDQELVVRSFVEEVVAACRALSESDR